MTKKRLVVHIGIQKTGSSAIQHTLAGNAELLARNGILYPKYPAAPPHAFNHNRLAWGLLEGFVDFTKLRNWAESLAQTDAHTLVLSAEDFCRLRDLEFLACFRDFFEPEIVVYLRRQDAWVGSWYNQLIKWPYASETAHCTPNEFLGHLQDFFWINYFDTVERWANAVGKDRILIRLLERGQIEDPVADMCDICGVDFVLDNAMPENAANESLPAAQVKILQDIDILQYAHNVRVSIIEASKGIPVASRNEIYPVPVRRLILERYADGNAKVAEHYLGRNDRILFRDDSFPDNPVYRENPLEDEHLYCFARNLIDVFRANEARVAAQSGARRRAGSSVAQANVAEQ